MITVEVDLSTEQIAEAFIELSTTDQLVTLDCISDTLSRDNLKDLQRRLESPAYEDVRSMFHELLDIPEVPDTLETVMNMVHVDRSIFLKELVEELDETDLVELQAMVGERANKLGL
jgi:hypothetical protein